MSVWLALLFVIQAFGLIGLIGALVTKRTQAVFVAGFNTMLGGAAVYFWYAGSPTGSRAILVWLMVGFYLFRINWMLLFWSRQTALEKLDGTMSLALKAGGALVLANIMGWAYCLPFYYAFNRQDPLGWMDFAAIAIYVVGTIFHFGGDYQKRKFKLMPESRGKLLNTGFWSLCRHPNYFGDFLIYVAFGFVGGAAWGWVCPAVNLIQYLFDAIPKNEAWAEERYKEDWDTYKKKTKMLIPYLF